MSGETLDDGRADQVVGAVDAYVENTTGRSFGEIKTITDEVHDAGSVIFLRHADVTEVTSVKRGRGAGESTTLPTDSYYVNTYGRLVLSEARNGFNPYRDYVKVSYNYGVATVPADLKLAALSIAADFYTYAADGNVVATEVQVGSYREKVASGQGTATGVQHFGIINRYRTRNV
jgi:hypothetical protein